MATLSPNLDIIVIGANQAGLTLGFNLRRTSFRFQLVGRNSRFGDTWRMRFDSLVVRMTIGTALYPNAAGNVC